MRSVRSIIAGALFASAFACLGDGNVGGGDGGAIDDAGRDPAAIYELLGEEAGITRLIDGFILRVADDARINGFFLNSSVNGERLARCLVKFLGAATGGPQTYPGPGQGADGDGCRNMKDAHAGLGISTNDYADLGEHLLTELREEGLPESDVDVIATALTAIAGDIIEYPENDETVYLRLLRKPGVTAIINDFVGRVVTNPTINGYFLNASVDPARLTTCLIRQVCAATGGPCVYGEEVGIELFGSPCQGMLAVHQGLGISLQDFNDLAGDLIGALRTAGVPQADIDAIVMAIGPLAPEIIEDPDNNGSVYQLMGRKPEVKQVIDDFIPRVLADPRINGYFLNAGLDAARLGTCLTRQVCQAAGGPCKYGEEVAPELHPGGPCKSMLEAHANLNVSNQDYADLADHLVDALEAQTALGAGDINAILNAITPLVDQVVTAPNNDETIYHRFGRKPVIQQVINDFIGRVVTDPKINGFFLNSDLDADRLATCLVRQLCAATGGPCLYGQEAGPELYTAPCRGMEEVHRSLGISTADFNDLAGALVGSLTSSSPLSQADIDTIVGVIGPLAAVIVEDPSNDRTIYQRMGRKPAIQVIIADFITRVVGDATLVGFFTATNAERLGVCLVRQVCLATGGPCKYGLEAAFELFDDTPCKSMADVHMNATNPVGGGGAPITRADFDQLVGHLVDAMVAAGSVLPDDRDAIVGALAPLCPQIVAGGTGC
jgi:truncated hemoglobin YjbI